MTRMMLVHRSDGGHTVEAVLAHEHGDQVKATVVDNCNGTYSLAFKIHAQGDWTLQTKVSPASCYGGRAAIRRSTAALLLMVPYYVLA